MKRKLQIVTGASVASFLAITVMAQDTANPNPNTSKPESLLQQPSPQRPLRANRDAAAGRAEKASDILGMEVKNLENQKLGKVAELAVDLESGRIVQVILSSGGLLGVGDSHFAVPPSAFHCDLPNKVIHLKTDMQKLKIAPKFEMSKWEDATQAPQVTEVYRYYGEEPYFGATQETDKAANNGSGRLGYVQKASKLIGAAVKNVQDEKLGKVENLMVDLQAGRVLVVIVSSGGFLGLGDELSAVPPTVLKYNPDHSTLVLDSTREALAKAPHFKADQWPEMNQPGYAEGVYRAYQVPYFTATSGADVNNSGRNVRDRDNQTLTPSDQSNRKGDVETTSRIRKEIIASKDMSVSARNVKIITANGRVTLRGPVNTADEKRIIGEIASRIAGAGSVDDQLEVRLTPTGKE